MKRFILFFLAFILGAVSYAQPPQAFKYQAVARDASGNFSAGTITASLSGNASTATSATSATTATNLAGGVAGAVPYQSASGTTGFSAAGTSGQVLTSAGTAAPTWTTATSANTASTIVARDASGNFSAGTITASLSGNATTATQVSNSLTLATSGIGLTGSATFNGATAQTFTVTSNATSSNSASTIVARNAIGNFSAGTITASLSGNATSATTATNLAGGSAGTVPYQSAAGTTVQLAAGSSGQVLTSNGAAAPSWTTPATVNNGTLTMNVSGTGLSGSQTFTANQSSAATFTVTSNATSANTASTIVARDASGNFSAGTITATLSGNASTATSATSATTATTATNQSGGTVAATTGTFSSTLGVTGRASLNGGFQGTVARGSYGSVSLHGTLNNYSGIDVNDQAVTWMTSIADGVSFGVYKSNTTWAFYFDANGVLQSGTVPGGKVTGNISGNAANITAYTINQSVGTGNNVQFNSLGVGTAASGTAGEIRATNNVTAYYSDDRLKTKLGGIEKALEKLLTLEGFYYEANQTAQDLGYEPIREVGVSAQQVQAVLPEVVVPAPIDERYLTVRYEKLIPLLIEAIKELSDKVDRLR